MEETDKDTQPADACCEGDGAKASACGPGDAAGDCACCAPAPSERSWLKLLIAGVVLLAAAWLGIRSMAAKPDVRPDAQSAVASGSAMGATLPANAQQPGNQGQPSCCGGGKAPAATGGAAPPKCGGGTPGCCGR
jgi:hypothetical protein